MADLVTAVHEALSPEAITFELESLWGEAPSYVNPRLDEMLVGAIADAVIRRVRPMLTKRSGGENGDK